MAVQPHDDARQSSLVNREAARRRRGLDGPRRRRDQNLDRTPLGVYVHDRRHDLGSARFSSFSAWGVEVKNASLLLVLKLAPLALASTDWYSLVIIGNVGI